VFIDDYAHHPEELRALISSTKRLYPTKNLTVIFQPHLFSRTRDFADGFAESLSIADQAIILPIYPAREKPIEGVSSSMIGDKVKTSVSLIDYESVESYVDKQKPELLVTAGAGDIDKCVEPLKNILLNQ
jgi:UDP-N-acetylmuramate--alanine ligase